MGIFNVPSAKFDTMTSKNFAEMIGLIAGMADFMPLVKFTPNIIHGRINDYYAAEEQNDNVAITGVKANTADMIISSADANKTIEAMKTDTFTFDKKGGELTTLLLLSLPLTQPSTTMFTSSYSITINLQAKATNMKSIRAGIKRFGQHLYPEAGRALL